MAQSFDVIVVGSGPAGVSVSYPMVEAGLRVLMVDGGRTRSVSPPSQSYINSRIMDQSQSNWMVGKDFHSLKLDLAASPKLRVPTHKHVFEGFLAENQINGKNFITLGSLAAGGLSEAWGCGVAALDDSELADFPFSPESIRNSYAAVAKRIGISGACDDDLAQYFGLDKWADPPIPLDRLQAKMMAAYRRNGRAINAEGVRLGRSRVAALSRDHRPLQLGEAYYRFACNLSGNCLWGCSRKSLYTAAFDLERLRTKDNFTYVPGFIVDSLSENEGRSQINGHSSTNREFRKTYAAKKIVLCAGTLATTRLALNQMKAVNSAPLQTCPNAAFLVWRPASLGIPAEPSFGLGQISFSVKFSNESTGFGSFFSSTGIPISEFVRAMPFKKPYAVQILRRLLTSCVVGNIFLPGKFTEGSVALSRDGALTVRGNYLPEVKTLMHEAKQKLSHTARKLGAVILPFSFTIGQPGGDLHYACSLPMKCTPKLSETDRNGKISGLKNIYAADGSVLPTLSAKSHTLTIMANADRIGRELAKALDPTS